MKHPRTIQFRGRLYALVLRADEPIAVCFLPHWRSVSANTYRTACGYNVDISLRDGTTIKRDVTCARCRKKLGLPAFRYLQVKAVHP